MRFALMYAAAWLPFASISATAAIIAQREPRIQGAFHAFLSTSVAAVLGLPIWVMSGYLEERASRTQAIIGYVLGAVAYSLALADIISLLMPPSSIVPRPAFVIRLLGPAFLYFILMLGILAVRNFMRAERNQRAALLAESLRTRAELQALRAHLDPHFLFNTFNVIAAVVETDPAQGRDMLVRAGAMLRRILELGAFDRDRVTVAEEMALVSEYLAFERLRMTDRLHVDVAISDEALECEIPAFVIQPLVENAIKHGLFPQPHGGTLAITGSVDDGTLHLAVRDTGAGASSDALATATGFGLRATRQRIEGTYGVNARVDVETAPGRGFAVRLALPAAMQEPRAGALA